MSKDVMKLLLTATFQWGPFGKMWKRGPQNYVID